MHYPLLVGTSTDIEEIRRFSTVIVDEVQGRHGQARTIPDHPDISVQFDVGETVPLCLSLPFGQIPVLGDPLSPRALSR